MLGDPMKGYRIAILMLLVPVGWFAALYLGSDAIFARMGMGMHPVTFLMIFMFLATLAAAGVFHRLATVKAELLAGNRVLARWSVDRATFERFVPLALADDRADKRQALVTVWFFLAVIFGGFAIYDPEVALPMMSVAAFVAAMVGLAFLIGQSVNARQMLWRDGVVIVGERGLLLNGVLHCWGIPFSWLSNAALDESKPDLTVMYAYLSRYGPQFVTVTLPVSAATLDQARIAEHRLLALAGKVRRARSPRSRRVPRASQQ